MSDEPDPPVVLLYDGVCNLCHGFVQWVIARDRRARIHFAALQSATGQRVLRSTGFQGPTPDSVVLVEDGVAHLASSGALRAAGKLGFPWFVLGWLRVVPRFLRDAVYRWVARRRYGWFGQKGSCPMPSPEQRARFLDADDPEPDSWRIPSEAGSPAAAPRT